jgi:hypothetical protein
MGEIFFRLLDQNIVRKRDDFSRLLGSNTVRTGAAKREVFFTTTVARLVFSLWQRLEGGFFFYSQSSCLFLTFSLF